MLLYIIARAGEHSDYGCITLLWQDDVGGLEVRSNDGQWIQAPCIKDTCLVNTGDLMQRWTNDTFKSTRHRVSIPKSAEKLCKDRYSIAFFTHPNHDVMVVPFDTCIAHAEGDGSSASGQTAAKYPPISAGAYLQQKLMNSY